MTLGSALLPAQAPIKPSAFPKISSVDERFQSFNIEMVEVTGGRFWKPYADQGKTAPAVEGGAGHPAGMDPSLYEYRAPIDLTNAKLRRLASALGPAYVRVSGTWANNSYFQSSDGPAPATAPQGFNGVLTAQQWKGVVDFSKAVDAKIVTSFGTSVGTRDANGLWTSNQAAEFLTYTKAIGGHIAAAEYMNEPNFAEIGGAPKGYNAAAYGKDVAVFTSWAKEAAPDMLILGPGSVGEGVQLVPGNSMMHLLKSEDLLSFTDPKALDAFSYHFYGAVSKRCSPTGAGGTSPDSALSEDFLGKTGRAEEFYAGLRDRFAAGKPMWLTETGQAACGGDLWASSFIDSFRYLNQLGLLARNGVQVVAHNTLAASDYGLIDEKTLTPRPNYWSALLWRKFMGTTVLDAGKPPTPSLHIYAQCLRNVRGGVSMLVINNDRAAEARLKVAAEGSRYTLTAHDLLERQVELNGSELKLNADDSLPEIAGLPVKAGKLSFAPASITFLVMPEANNRSCH